ncbi:TniQ family protein [Rhizobacter sp. AJA081-3]|nr:TniQ family protein [Rhizobacter sp. AJA081-3]
MLAGTILPFVPQPYEDELLSSWIGRVALHNGKGAWMTLLRKAGISQRRRYFHNHIPQYCPQVRQLLGALGWSVEDAYLQLTPAPFLLAFCAHPTARIGVDVSVPEVLGNMIQPAVALHRRRATSFARALRFCPMCIATDLEEFGEAYWHRQHQLPLPAFCAKHSHPLFFRCQSCGHLPTNIPYLQAPLLPVRCRCGFDLRTTRMARGGPSEEALKQIQLGSDSLSLPLPSWNGLHVRRALQRLARSQNCSGLNEFLNAARKSAFDGIAENLDSLKRRTLPGRYSATTLAAAAVSLGLDMRGAVDLFQAESASTVAPLASARTRVTLKHLAKLSVPELREAFARSLKTRVLDYRLLAILQLRDLAWLRECDLYRSPLIELPTIEGDRATITRIRNGGAASRHYITSEMANMRARLRDLEWYQRGLREIQRGHEHLRIGRMDWTKLRSELIGLMDRYESDPGRPQRVPLLLLAQATGRAENTIQGCFDRFPDVRERFSSLKASLPLRRLQWAAITIRKEGRVVMQSTVIQVSGITAPYDDSIRQMARRVAQEANEKITVSESRTWKVLTDAG